MSLDKSKLKNVQEKHDKITAQCPACAAQGRDSQGEHLVVYNTGEYGCAANPGNADHSRTIYSMVGKVDTNHTPRVPLRIFPPRCATRKPKTIMVLDWLEETKETAISVTALPFAIEQEAALVSAPPEGPSQATAASQKTLRAGVPFSYVPSLAPQ